MTGQDGADEWVDDLGEPITELRDLGDPVPEGFLGRIRSSIHRRSLVGDLTRFSVWTPALVVLEFLDSIFAFLGASQGTDQEESDS